MTDPRAPGSAQADLAARQAEEAAREARHEVLIDLLGAFADDELPPETVSQIDAHLVGCARCRRELSVHRAMRMRLEAEPLPAAPSALRDRVRASIATSPAPVMEEPVSDMASPSVTPRTRVASRPAVVAIGASAVAVIALVALMIYSALPGVGLQLRGTPASATNAFAPSRVQTLTSPAAAVPLLAGVLADYRRVSAGDLPGRARDLATVREAVDFPVEPITGRGFRLLAAWTTDLGGEAAAVLAYRLDDRLVLQYLVPEQLFFRHPVVRSAVAAGHVFGVADGAQGVLGWAEPAAGSLLVADLSPDRLARAWAARR